MVAPSRKRTSARKSAVALQFEKGKMGAPQITAKGRGLIAEGLIAAAREHNVPIVENALLVEALEPLELGREVPLEMYHVVAEILVAVYRANQESESRR
jgi:flagellar biosynthesis protein